MGLTGEDEVLVPMLIERCTCPKNWSILVATACRGLSPGAADEGEGLEDDDEKKDGKEEELEAGGREGGGV